MFFKPHGFTSSFGNASPLQKSVFVPARQAYSHSASVGRRQVLPSFALNHLQNAMASSQLTPVAQGAKDPVGWKSGRNCRNCFTVTSCSLMRNPCVIFTL